MDTLFNTIAPTTRKARINFLSKVGVKSISDYATLHDVNKVMNKFILDSDNVNTQATRIFHVIEYLKAIHEDDLLKAYIDKMKSIKEASNKKQNDTSTRDRADRYETPLETLQTILLSKNPYPNFNTQGASLGMIRAYQDYILLVMYVLNPALRNDLHNLSIINKRADIAKTGNFLVVNPRALYIHLNEFKNSKSMGSIRVDLTDYTKQLIRNLFKIYKPLKLKPTSLFNHISKTVIEPMTEDAIKKRVKFVSGQYFGNELSINDYRHLWEMSIQNNDSYKSLNLNDREALHKKLLHSMNTALKYNRVN